ATSSCTSSSSRCARSTISSGCGRVRRSSPSPNRIAARRATSSSPAPRAERASSPMKRLLLFFGIVVLIALFGAEVFLNPAEVESHPTSSHTFHLMLGLLLIITFLAGAVLAVLAGSVRSLGSMLAGWRGRRAARVVEQAGEW